MTTETQFDTHLKSINDCNEKLRDDGQVAWVKYIQGKMTDEEKAIYNESRRKAYIDFSGNECGKSKLQFLVNYLKATNEIHSKFKNNILHLFNTGEFAVLAVRLNSKEIFDIALESLEASIVKNNDFRDDIVNLTLVYNAGNKIGLKSQEVLHDFADNSINETTKKLIADFISRKPIEKTLWSMGYQESFEYGFGFLWIGDDSDYQNKKPKKQWWKF